MSNRIHALAQQLTGKATIEECSLEEVKHIAKRFPYFAPAQFLLLQKLRQLNLPEADNQHKKAVLFFHDPLLFDYFISSDKFYVDEALLFSGPEVDDVTVQDENVAAHEADTLPSLALDEKGFVETNEIKVQDGGFITSSPENDSIKNETMPYADAAVADKTSIEPALPTMIEKELPEDPPTHEEETVKTEEPKSVLPPDMITGQIGKELKPPETTSSELSFEPYHTVDYFASQGIKISQEELPKDKLGKQLKSFTEWLKTMKRLPTAQISETVEILAEKKVESMADSSVSESEVVTETMAEVWAKQGNREKAMETYNKLSLLNPSKRAYFAAKIENLKQL